MANIKTKTAQDLPAGFSLIRASVASQPEYERISEGEVTPLDFDLWGCWAAFDLGFQANILSLHELQNNCDNCVAQALHMARMQELNPLYRRKNTNKFAEPRPENPRTRLQYCLSIDWWQFIPVCRPINDTPRPYGPCCRCNRSGTAGTGADGTGPGYIPGGCDPSTLPDPRNCGPRPDGYSTTPDGPPSHWPKDFPGRPGQRGWGSEDSGDQYDWCAANKTGDELTTCLQAVTDWNDCQEGNFEGQDNKDICIDEEGECDDFMEDAFEDCKQGRRDIWQALLGACMGGLMNGEGEVDYGDEIGGVLKDIDDAIPGIIESDPQE